MKGRFGPKQAIRSVLGHTYLLIRHELACWLA
jgi:hypothetical protein